MRDTTRQHGITLGMQVPAVPLRANIFPVKVSVTVLPGLSSGTCSTRPQLDAPDQEGTREGRAVLC